MLAKMDATYSLRRRDERKHADKRPAPASRETVDANAATPVRAMRSRRLICSRHMLAVR